MTTTVNPLLVGLATWCLISVGLGLILATALFPFLLWAFQPPARQWYYILPICLVQITHLYMLWTDKAHLAAYRFLSLPLRRALLPVVMYVIKMDAVKEKEDVACLFWDEQDIDDPNARPGGHHGHGGFGGMDQEMLFEMFMRQQMGGRRGRGGGGGFPGGFHFG